MEKVHVSVGMFWVALVVLIVLFMGKPDLYDALMFHLSGGDLANLTDTANYLD